MNVIKRIVISVALAAVVTAAAVVFAPGLRPVKYVVPVLGLGFLGVILLASISFYREEDLTLRDKEKLMNGFLVAILVPSLYTTGAFMHQSFTSWSGGEIHYHADFEVLVERDGELRRLDLIDPSKFCRNTTHESSLMCSLNDRTGSTKYHEHNDNRIHLEGIFRKREDATLAAFFETFGGELSSTRLVYPTNDGKVSVREEDGKELKIIVQRGTGGNRHWCLIGSNIPESSICDDPYNNQKANSPSEYVISPYKKDTTKGVSLDDIFIIYDSSSKLEALRDLQKDGKYRGMGLRKRGEGF